MFRGMEMAHMATKLIKELQVGDRVQTEDGATATITYCKPSRLFEAAPKLGGAYEIEYHDGEEIGRAVASGYDEIKTA